jgi:hypothetical protein
MNKVDMVTDDDRRWKFGLYMCLLISIMLWKMLH